MVPFSTQARSVALLVAVAVCCLAAAPPPMTPLQARLERVQYYELALADQREALRQTRARLQQALQAYQTSVNKEGEDTAAYRTETNTLTRLEGIYTKNMLATMKQLADEYERLARTFRGQGAFNDALRYLNAAAPLWDERGEILGEQAEDLVQDAKFSPAAAQFEKAATEWQAARAIWEQAIRISRAADTDREGKELQADADASAANAMQALRSAADSYFSAYQFHKQRAASQELDIYARNAGQEWQRTAGAQQNYERVVRQIEKLSDDGS